MRKRETTGFGIDPSGRLKYMRLVLDGEFGIDKGNILSYRVRKPIPSDVPQQIRLGGRWSLNNGNNITVALDKENIRGPSGTLTLEGQVIDTRADALILSLTTKDSDGNSHIYAIRLGGKWQVDKRNRLSFQVAKEKGPPDTLTFSGSWVVNGQNQLIFTYAQQSLKKKQRSLRTITFKGYWDINEINRLSYILSEQLGSGFDFKVSLGKPARRGLEYELGASIAPKKNKITLFGSWKINEKTGLLFEMPYADGKIRSIVFGADCRLAGGTDLEFKLRNNLHKDLGISLRLNKSILKGAGNIFLEALKDGKTVSLFAGVGFRW